MVKGFIPYAGSYAAFPHSMEWFYLPLNAVMTGPNTFDWKPLEAQLDAIAGRGHQAAFRFYLDYPAKPSGIPRFLLDQGLLTRPYDDFDNNGLSVSPDYDDPRLAATLDKFIAALGKRYDGDPRTGFIQLGLLGFWGEWHTWPHNGDPGTENWLNAPVGGELRPELQGCLFAVPMECGGDGDNNFADGVAQTHVSWLLNQYAFSPGYTGATYDNALAGAKSIGYNLRVAAVRTSRERHALNVSVRIQNDGVAPFYYDGLRAANPMRGGLPLRFATAGQDTTVSGWLTLGRTRVS